MNKSILLILYLFFSLFFSFSQSNYNIEYEFKDKNDFVGISNLMIQENRAVFKILDDRESGIQTNKNSTKKNYVINDELSRFTYSDGDYIHTRIPYRNREIIYKFQSNLLEWKFTEERKKIKDFSCQKAILELNGRTYEVWFTTQIPINFGPLRLNGLPGLVVEATIDQDFMNFKLLKIKKIESGNSIFNFHKQYFSNKKVLGYMDYEKLVTRLMTERKVKKLAGVAEMAAKKGITVDVNFSENHSAFTQYLIDIPKGLVEKLQKIN